jgi:2-polyprenyl-3-methyl-5-hydroxy-6-metoxy-1,4-benzoquinol methylase
MIKRFLRRSLRRLGYDIVRLPARHRAPIGTAEPPPVHPVWPLPRRTDLSDEEIRTAFERFPFWHFAYEFEGGLGFSTFHNKPGLDTDDPTRPLQRFRHFMPYVVESQGGTLRGKRILDIACNSGFWSIQCALLGADVVGFDGRPELVEQANLLKRITGAESATFKLLDFWEMTPDALGGTFDLVLNLGILYHLPKPLEALERSMAMTRGHLLLDTAIHPSSETAVYLNWEEPFDIRTAVTAGMVAFPTRSAIEMMLRHAGAKRTLEIPVRTDDLPLDYRIDKRASWLIDV